MQSRPATRWIPRAKECGCRSSMYIRGTLSADRHGANPIRGQPRHIEGISGQTREPGEVMGRGHHALKIHHDGTRPVSNRVREGSRRRVASLQRSRARTVSAVAPTRSREGGHFAEGPVELTDAIHAIEVGEHQGLEEFRAESRDRMGRDAPGVGSPADRDSLPRA
jgi:hypothetical protein